MIDELSATADEIYLEAWPKIIPVSDASFLDPWFTGLHFIFGRYSCPQMM